MSAPVNRSLAAPGSRQEQSKCVASASTRVDLSACRLVVSSLLFQSLLWSADVAQLVEHHLAKVRVAGSNPVIRSGRWRSGSALP